MKRILVAILAAAALMFAAPTAAQAYISNDYCAYSLRGGGTLAPDNDVLAVWNRFQSQGAQLSQSYAAWFQNGGNLDYVRVKWAFYSATSGYTYYTYFKCYWDYPVRVYHDIEAGVP